MMYVKATPTTDLNRNTDWFMYPGVWTTYILILFFSWLLILSVIGCTPGMAWTIVNLSHFLVTYHFFHWMKGTPFAEDQGIYNRLTWWEQIDNGKQLTRNRKFLTVVPVVLFRMRPKQLPEQTEKQGKVRKSCDEATLDKNRRVHKRTPVGGHVPSQRKVLNSLTHNRLPASNAIPQHSCCTCAGYCQVPQYA